MNDAEASGPGRDAQAWVMPGGEGGGSALAGWAPRREAMAVAEKAAAPLIRRFFDQSIRISTTRKQSIAHT